MTPRQRLLTAYTGGRPDSVPALADLSYWHAGNGGGKFIPGKTDGANRDKVATLLTLHRRTGAAIHVNLGSFYNEVHHPSVRAASGIRGEHYFHRLETPIGTVEEIREWSPVTFSWPITHHMIQDVEDLKVVRHVFEHLTYTANWDLLREVDAQVGELGLPLVQVPYSGMGFLMSRYAGVELTVMLAIDAPDELTETLAVINAAHAKSCRLMAEGPSQVMIHSDNLSADVQSPPWVLRHSGEHYARMAAIAHEYGKPIVTHIDGRLRGLLRTTRDLGFDGADAVTPAPWGDLTPAECRAEAGPRYVLSGGVPPGSFHPDVPLAVFDAQVEAWLALRHQSPALIIAPGDQLPPDGDLDRVTRMVAAAARATY
jgi:hypothetical protein